MSLLDPNSQCYEITWVDDFFSKDGLDVFEDGKKIGKLKEISKSRTQDFGFFDNDNSLVLSMPSKHFFSDSRKLLDEKDVFLGVCHCNVRKDVVRFEDNNGKEILIGKKGKQEVHKESQEVLMNFEIIDNEKKDIARLSVIRKKMQQNKKGFLSKLRRKLKTSSSLENIKPNFDRKLLLGFFLLSLYYFLSPGETGA